MTTCRVLKIIWKFSILAYSWLFLVRNSGGKSNGDTRKFWNCGIFKLFPKLRKWSWNVFRGEITSVRCFFFRGNIVVNVSPTLKNRHFFTVQAFLALLQRPLWVPRGHFCINKVYIFSERNRKNCENIKILLETCKVTSKLSADSFVGCWDLLVAQKWDFKKKIFEMEVN